MQNPSLVEALAQLAAQGTNALRISALFAAAWSDTNTNLSRVIGVHGAGALSKQSLVRASRDHSWLGPLASRAGFDIDPHELRSVLSQQPAAEAAAGAGAILESLDSLLVRMIGPPLTRELLGSAWRHILEENNISRDES